MKKKVQEVAVLVVSNEISKIINNIEHIIIEQEDVTTNEEKNTEDSTDNFSTDFGPPSSDVNNDDKKKRIMRVYELKKLFNRLNAFSNLLLDKVGTRYSKIFLQYHGHIEKSKELLKLVIDNLSAYKEKLDDIIIEYYKFLKQLSKELTILYDLVKRKEV